MHKQKTILNLAACCALTLAANTALAQTHYNQVSLRAEASIEVAHDLMQVVLYTEEQDSDAARLAEQITQKLNQAIARSKQANQVKISLGGRHSQPVHQDKSKKIIAWRERAELRLESTDFAQLSTLTGQLLQDLNMASMRFAIASATRVEHENQLLSEAIDAFAARAKLTSAALGGKDYKLVNLNLNSQGGYQPPMYRSAMVMKAQADESYSTPEIEAGTSELKMIADGMIEVIH